MTVLGFLWRFRGALLAAGVVVLVLGQFAWIQHERAKRQEAAVGLYRAEIALRAAHDALDDAADAIKDSERARADEYDQAVRGVERSRTRCDRAAAWDDGYAAGLADGGRRARDTGSDASAVGECAHGLRESLGQVAPGLVAGAPDPAAAGALRADP